MVIEPSALLTVEVIQKFIQHCFNVLDRSRINTLILL